MFSDFIDKVRDRRRRHQLQGDVCLLPDLKKINPLANWIEFQNYHLELHEGKEMEIKDEREKSDIARKTLESPGFEEPEVMGFLEGRVKYDERKLEEHSKMLRWIEQQRRVMVAERAASIYSTGDHDRPRSMPLPTSSGRRKRNQKSPAPLGLVRSAISKKHKELAPFST